MTKKLVWIVEDIETGDIRSNWSTGTRVYTRKHNAENACSKNNHSWRNSPPRYHVVEYELVPTSVESE